MKPKGPETPKVKEGLQGGGGALTQPAAPGPSHIGKPMKTEGEKPLGVGTIDLNVTILADLPEDPADIIILDDDELSFPGDYPKAVSTPKIDVASDRKRSSEETIPAHLFRRSGPQKKQRACLHMMYLSQKGQRRKTSSPGDMRSFASDYEWVQCVRGSLLRLEADN